MSFITRKQEVLLLLIIGLIVSAIYLKTLGVPFVFDDGPNINENFHIRLNNLSLEGFKKAGFDSPNPNRPVTNISFGLNYYFGGYDVFGYHLVNIVIHMITGLLLYLLVKTTLLLSWGTDRDASILKPPAAGAEPARWWRSLDPSWVSFWAAALWLVHPVQTQSVTYIVQRMNSMAAMFCVLCLLLYARGRISQKLRFKHSRHPSIHPYVLFAGSLVGGLLAFGSKETAATLPFFILLYELYFFQDLNWSWLKRNWIYFVIIWILFFLVAAVYMGNHPLDRILSGYGRRDFTLDQRVLTEFRVVIFYLSLLIWPHPSRLNLEHDFALSYSLFNPVTTVMSLGVIVGLLALGIYLGRRHRILSFCLLWFLGNLVIESSVIGLELVFEHRLYMPSMFLSLAVVMLFCRYVRHRWLQALLLGMVVMVSAFWTFERNNVWKDEVTFYRDCIQKSPTNSRARDGLGSALLKRGQVEEAIVQYNECLRLDPDFASAHNNLGVAHIRLENFSQAIYHFQEALRLVPGYAHAFNNLNKLEESLRIDGEITKTKSKLTQNPEDPAMHYALGNLYMRSGKLDEAKTHYQKSLGLDSEHPSALSNLASIYALTGNYDKAISLFKEVTTRQPDHPDAFFYIACVYAKQNKKAEAIGWLKKAAGRGYLNPNIFKSGLDLDTVLRSSFDGEKRPAVETGH